MKINAPSSGIALDRTLTILLAFFAAEDGLPTMDESEKKALSKKLYSGIDSATLKSVKQNLLSSALVQGGFHLLTPKDASSYIDFEPIKLENIPLQSHHPYNLDKLEKLFRLHSKISSIARFLEYDSRTAKMVSLEGLIDGTLPKSSQIKFETMLDDYEYYSTQFLREIQWFDDLAPSILPLFLRHYLLHYDTLSEVFTDELKSADLLRKSMLAEYPDGREGNNIFELMGLIPRPDVNFRSSELEMALDLFPKNYFREFLKYDGLFGEFSNNDFTDHATRGLALMFTDPIRLFKVHSFWRTTFEIQTLVSVSANFGARINLPEGSEKMREFELSKDEEKVQLYKLYVKEINSIPRIDTFSDFFRLYNHKYVDRFRGMLNEWSLALHSGETNILNYMREDFQLALKDLSKVAKMQKIGDILTIVGLPVAIAGLLTGLPLDFGFSAVGPAILAYSRSFEYEAEWVKFGNLEL